MASTRPGMSAELYRAWEGLAKGEQPDLNKFTVRPYTLWHRQSIGTSTPTSMSWFNTASSPHVTNMPQANSLSNETAMWITGVRVLIAQGYEPDGTAQADGEPYQSDADAFSAAADLDILYKYGQLVLSLAGREYINEHGLYKFPAGGGADVHPAVEDTNTTVLHAVAIVNNGIPLVSNRYLIPAPIPLPPGKNIECTTKFNISRTLKDTYCMKVELEGVLIYPANN